MAGTSLNVDKRDSVLMRISTVDVLYNCPPYHSFDFRSVLLLFILARSDLPLPLCCEISVKQLH